MQALFAVPKLVIRYASPCHQVQTAHVSVCAAQLLPSGFPRQHVPGLSDRRPRSDLRARDAVGRFCARFWLLAMLRVYGSALLSFLTCGRWGRK